MPKVLIANDDAPSRHVLRNLVANAGYVVIEAAHKDATMAILNASPEPLVVLLDFSLARWNGVAILRTVVGQPHLAKRHAFVLMLLRDETMPLMTAQALSQMSVKLVAKPFKVDSVLAAIMEAAQHLDMQASNTVTMDVFRNQLPTKDRGLSA